LDGPKAVGARSTRVEEERPLDATPRATPPFQVHVYRLVTANTIEEKIVERAKKKLKLDAMVVQRGNLSQGTQGPSKDEMLEAVTYGASAVFRADGDEGIADEDLDAIISRGRERTALLDSKIASADDKGDMLDFKFDGGRGPARVSLSDQGFEFLGLRVPGARRADAEGRAPAHAPPPGPGIQTFEGVDYSDEQNRASADADALRAAAVSSDPDLGERKRSDYHRDIVASRIANADKPKKAKNPARGGAEVKSGCARRSRPPLDARRGVLVIGAAQVPHAVARRLEVLRRRAPRGHRGRGARRVGAPARGRRRGGLQGGGGLRVRGAGRRGVFGAASA